MPLAKIAAPAALAGGVLWIASALLGGDGPLPGTLHFLGLVLVLASAAVFGSTLVKSDALGMRVLVAFASALLLLSLVEAFRPATPHWYDAFWGALAALVGATALLRRRGRSPGEPAAGAHAR